MRYVTAERRGPMWRAMSFMQGDSVTLVFDEFASMTFTVAPAHLRSAALAALTSTSQWYAAMFSLRARRMVTNQRQEETDDFGPELPVAYAVVPEDPNNVASNWDFRPVPVERHMAVYQRFADRRFVDSRPVGRGRKGKGQDE